MSEPSELEYAWSVAEARNERICQVLEDNLALLARIAKLEGDIKIIETSFTDVCDALGCPYDNEAALFAVEALRARVAKLEATAIDVAASLAAAISLLERGGKKAAPSDKMFEQMLVDYRNSLERARAALSETVEA